MVVVYKTSLVTWMLAKIFVTIPNIGLVNVVAGKKIVPELVQFDATPEKLANEVQSLITNEIRLVEIKDELKKVRELLGEGEASRRAAQEIISHL